jgi:cytochrome c oxidase subunit 1/cytochrome c oxidase subunit I+III
MSAPDPDGIVAVPVAADRLVPEARAGQRLVIDAAALPDVVFGRRALTWWATAGFILIEGTTLAILAASYLYLRINAAEWPPRPASAPALLLPTLGMLTLLVKCVPMLLASRAAQRLDATRTRRWLTITTLVALATLVIRWFEFKHSLNVRWDTSAYGSALWGVYVAHSSLMATDALELGTIAAVFHTGRLEPKHFTDVEDSAFYEYFLSLAWVVLYAIVILGPRVL